MSASQNITVPKKSKRCRIVVGGIAVILLAGIIIVVRLLTAPVTGHNVGVDSSLAPQHQAKAKPSPPSNLANKYFALSLPVGYRLQANTQTAAGLLYQQTITKPSTFGSLIINIGLKALPEGGLSADSSYRLRQQQARYSLASQTVKGEAVEIANDTQSAAVVAFWPHAGYLATVSVTSGISNPGASDNADQQAVLKQVLQGWQWK